jgi:molybdate transport system ATP-binding protein
VEARLLEPVTVVMGPSGAGKTSLLEAVAGLRPRARGRITLGARVLLDSAAGVALAPEARRVGYVPQDAGLFPHLSALDNVRFGARGRAGRVESAVRMLELEPLLARRPASLSGGEKQRVALARALAAEPDALLFDEPLAALDVGLRERVLPYLLRVRDEWRVPLLYVTHNVGEALALQGEVLLLEAGRVAAQGAALELLGTPGLAREAQDGLENLLPGRVSGHDEAGGVTRVEIAGGQRLSAPLDARHAVGSGVTLAVRADDVLLAAEAPRALSARNVLPARVLSRRRVGPDVLVRCALDGGGLPWLVRVTPAAAADLGLEDGQAVFVAVKSHSLRVL